MYPCSKALQCLQWTKGCRQTRIHHSVAKGDFFFFLFCCICSRNCCIKMQQEFKTKALVISKFGNMTGHNLEGALRKSHSYTSCASYAQQIYLLTGGDQARPPVKRLFGFGLVQIYLVYSHKIQRPWLQQTQSVEFLITVTSKLLTITAHVPLYTPFQHLLYVQYLCGP